MDFILQEIGDQVKYAILSSQYNIAAMLCRLLMLYWFK